MNVITKKTKLALYLPSLRGGGAERVMVTLANGIAQRGYAVDLVLAKAEGPYLGDVAENVRVVDLRAARVATSLPGLVRYLRRERPVAMLSALSHANVIAVLARRLAGVPVRLVISEHNNLSTSKANASSWRGSMIGHFMRWAYPYADRIVAVSEGVAHDLANHVRLQSIDAIYNPIVTDALKTLSCAEANHPWLTARHAPVVLGVGRLAPEKDFSTLIKAFARLRETRDARLIILGEGELRSPLEALVRQFGLQEVVSLPGFASNPYAFMRQADLFVLSSAWEGLPTVLVEAMACGTSVVSTDCPSGPAEILENGRWGRLVPVGDEIALAEAMAATLDQTEHPDVAARAADFSVDRAVEGYLRVMVPDEYRASKEL